MPVSAIAASRPSGSAGRLTRFLGYRELLRALMRRELRAKYKGSALGILWSFIHPLLMMGVYTLVFSVLWKAIDVPHYPLFVLSGLVGWVFFQTSVQAGTVSLVANAQVITKVWFPREVIPIAVVVSQAASSLIMLAVVIPVNVAVVPEVWQTVLLSVPIFAALISLALGLAMFLATANVFLRDVEHFIGILLLPWFFLTPVFYSLEQLPGAAGHPVLVDLLRYGNPVTPYVEGIRATILEGSVPGPGALAYVFLVGPLVALAGLWILQRYDDRLAVEL
jgi:lipopolysaccharide transport system permease protein